MFPVLAVVALPALESADDTAAQIERIAGCWNVTVRSPSGTYPSWFEIRRTDAGDRLTFLGRVGSPRPVEHYAFDGARFEFSVPPQFESTPWPLEFKARWNGRYFAGETTTESGEPAKWTAVRAPELPARPEPRWGKPVALFDGQSLANWQARDGHRLVFWHAENGALVAGPGAPDLVTRELFRDFRLRLEYRLPPLGDGGVYLRGRYEVQLTRGMADEPPNGRHGSIYGRIPVAVELAVTGAGEWHALQATLLGRYVTLVLDGRTVIENARIDGPTGGALDADEGRPGPILLQAMTGGVEFRKIEIQRAR